VWKVEVKVGDRLENEQIVAVLEAMKPEIPVKAEGEGGVVEKVLVKSNDVVEAGRPLVLLRMPRN
jgi:urea carboxylase